MPRAVSATPTADPLAHREPVLTSAKEAARILGVTRNYVYELCARGVLESRYLGQRRMILVTSLDALIESLPAERGA